MTSQTPEKIMRTMSAPTAIKCACTDRSCIIAALRMRTPCVNEASDASQAIWVNCLAADSTHRGVFVASRSAGSPVCSGRRSLHGFIRGEAGREDDSSSSSLGVFSALSRNYTSTPTVYFLRYCSYGAQQRRRGGLYQQQLLLRL